ncbi:TPA: hypothetical protein ACKP7H_002365 [Serratia marcescens]
MTLTTTEELKHLASSDNAKELTRRLARECLANREAQPVQVTDGMALDFHHALTDGSIGSDELEEIKVGLRAALCNVTAPPAPAVPGIDELRLTFERSERESDDGFNLHKYGIGYADEATQARWESWLSCRAAMLNHVGDANEKAAEKCECPSIDYCDNCLRAMLDQPVNSGYKLVPVDFLTTASRLIDLCRTYSILSDGGNYKERTISECESTMEVIDGLLTAAPESGNGA